jgi:hypothetical protein
LEPKVRRALAVSGEIEFLEAVTAAPNEVLLGFGDFRITFKSVTSDAEWRSAMNIMPPKRIESAQALIAHARKIASRALGDEAFRARLPGLAAWLDAFVLALPSFARQGITCAGSRLQALTIADNHVYGFAQGVHVAGSQNSDVTVTAQRVVVRENHLSCRKPAGDAYMPCALFVGNLESAWIERNLIDWAGPAQARPYPQGIRVWGRLGRFLAVSENRIRVATMGIRVRATQVIPVAQRSGYQWVAADNLVDGEESIALRAPEWMKSRHNRPGTDNS